MRRVAEIDLLPLDRAAGVRRDGVSIPLDEQAGPERDDPGVDCYHAVLRTQPGGCPAVGVLPTALGARTVPGCLHHDDLAGARHRARDGGLQCPDQDDFVLGGLHRVLSYELAKRLLAVPAPDLVDALLLAFLPLLDGPPQAGSQLLTVLEFPAEWHRARLDDFSSLHARHDDGGPFGQRGARRRSDPVQGAQLDAELVQSRRDVCCPHLPGEGLPVYADPHGRCGCRRLRPGCAGRSLVRAHSREGDQNQEHSPMTPRALPRPRARHHPASVTVPCLRSILGAVPQRGAPSVRQCLRHLQVGPAGTR